MIIKGLCRQFFGKMEKTQTMYINSVEKLNSINLNKKLDVQEYNFMDKEMGEKTYSRLCSQRFRRL